MICRRTAPLLAAARSPAARSRARRLLGHRSPAHQLRADRWRFGRCRAGRCRAGRCRAGRCRAGRCRTGRCRTGRCRAGGCRAGRCRAGRCRAGQQTSCALPGSATLRSTHPQLPADVVALTEALTEAPPPLPQLAAIFEDPSWSESYLGAVEWRFHQGGFGQSGPALVWARLQIPLVASEEPSGLQQLVTVADSGNALSSMLSFNEWWFINTEFSVHLVRPPVGVGTFSMRIYIVVIRHGAGGDRL